MKKIRIGNDIVIKWRVTINGEEVNLEGLDLSLYISTTYQPRREIAFTVAGNEITATYKGTAQKVTGVYRLTLYRNEGENSQNILDACDAFELVSCSCLTTDVAFGGAEVELPVADLGIGVPGLSAYEIAVAEGFEGTQAEWLASLSAASEAAAAECREFTDAAKIDERERQNNEALRLTAENERAANERTRALEEQKRVTAELLRASAEVSRKTAEEAREADEQQRSTAEVGRSSAEELRKSNEQSRISEETTRSNNEAARIAAETKRANAELTRKDNEDARQNAEQGRVTAETTRQSSEVARETAERSRATAEQQRITNETARSDAENRRVTAETARQTAETSRQEAEQGRETAEQARANAEAARAEEFATFEGKIAAKEDAANKVTSIGADANNTTFPTTRAVLNSIAEVKNIEVTPEMLSESTKQYINASGGGTITNLADDEDLTSVGNVLKLADKDYSPTSYSGMGRVYLRKNIVDGKNILTQEMMTKENTIYIIQYDYDLNGATINVPANCTLDFQGGSLGNGTVTFADTFIKGEPHIYTELGGSISNGKIDVTWFGIDNDGLTDASVRLQSLINLWFSKVIYFPTGKYLISNQILLRKGCYFSGDGGSSVLKLMYEGFNFEITASQSNYAVVVEIKDLNIVGTGPSWYDSDAESKKTECSFLEIKYPTAYTYRTNFSNVTISNVKECIKIDKCYWARFINVAMYSYDIALDLGDCNSTAIIGCTFRGGFDKGLYLHKLSGGTSAGIGVSINGCDFSGNNYCGLYIDGTLRSSSITGNYFESEPGRQIIIGEEGTTTSGMSDCLIYGNSGLWTKNGVNGIQINGSFTYNLLNASTKIVTKGTCRRNIGLDENSRSVGMYSEVFVYENKYSNGYIDSFRDQIFSDQIRDICIPANSKVTLYNFTARYFELLFFKSSISSVKLTIKTIEAEPIYLVGTADGGIKSYEDAKGFFTNSNGIIDLGAFKNCSVVLENTSSDNVLTNIELRYFKNIYGK